MSTSGITVKGDGSTTSLFGTAGDDAFAGSNASEFFFTGGGNDWVFANAGADIVYADLGNDWLDGGDGADTLDFSVINYVSSATSTYNYHAVVFDLAKTVNKLGYLGTKTTYGFENLVGSLANDKLYGDKGANSIDGSVGNDLIDGRSGNDTLTGGSGQDTLVGGAGADLLRARDTEFQFSIDGISDQFRYTKTSESSGTTTTTADSIIGYFDHGASNHSGDKIDLSRVDANGSGAGTGTFKFIGDHAFHSNSTSEVRVTAGGGYLFKVEVDTDRDNHAEMTIFVYNGASTMLTKADFIL